MKLLNLFTFLLIVSIGNAQSLPIDFESTITTADFIDFDGGTAMVIDNPQSNGINTSAKVAQIVRDGGEIWGGSKIDLTNNLDFTTSNLLTMKVFTTAPVGTVVKFKLETNGGATERDVRTTVSNEWETLTWDFTGEPTNFNSIVFMFDFGNVGNGSVASTFLFDDIEQLDGGEQIDWPVDFEGSIINYTVTDFGGNSSTMVADPTNPNNRVIQSIKTDQAATWAGTTIGTPAGFKTNLPLTLNDSEMTVRVWSPEAGTPVRLKVEDWTDPTHTCETETNTTLSGEWEYLVFDFANQAPGTESLSVGLSRGWTYNMASIFFNFGTEGMTAGEKTYYFDDVRFGNSVLGVNDLDPSELNVFPNPTNTEWTIESKQTVIDLIELFDAQGKRLQVIAPDNSIIKIEAANLAKGIYFSKISTRLGSTVVRLLKN